MTDHTSTPIGRLARWSDERLDAADTLKRAARYVFPTHFSFLFGEVALYAFLVLVATGTFLALFYSPGEAEVVYRGAYAPLVGVRMTEAYRSVVDLSFSVRAGLLVRQTHHWAALVFTGAILAHLCRVFFTGAFRRPRELNWMTGLVLLLLALVEGFAGYSLLDDLLSGTGLRIGYSIVESIPVVGADLVMWLWGGEYPGEGFLARLFAVHVFVFPALLAGLIGLHLALVVRQKHTQFPGPRRGERNVVGLPMWPTYAAESVGLLLVVAGVLAIMGGTMQINPVWLYGPYDPFAVSSGSQADWYILWVQGALRLMPSWELQLFGHTIPNQFFPGVLFPLLVFAVLFAWPWLEAAATGDRRPHHLLDRPRDRPVRTAIGGGALAGLVVLLVAGSDDVFATEFDWAIVTVRAIERWAFLVVPLVVGAITWKVCRDLAARGPAPPPHEVLPDEDDEDPGSSDGGPVRVRSRLAARVLRLGVIGAVIGAVARRGRS